MTTWNFLRTATAAAFLSTALVTAPVTVADSGKSHQSHKHQRNVVELSDARIKIEVNDTDGDAGIQVFLDVDLWRWLAIYDPRGRLVMYTTNRGSFAKQGGTELFLESAEPDFSDLSFEAFLQRFPAGNYRIRGRTIEGDLIRGTAVLSHNIPAGPELVYPTEDSGVVDGNNVTLMWNSVGAAGDSAIIGYQVLVVQEDADFDAIPKVALDIIMPASATSLVIPAGFLKPGTEYEWEVLAIESGGNQTLSASFLQTIE